MDGTRFGPATVQAAWPVAKGVRLVELRPAAGTRPYPTGAHVDLALTIGGLPDVRSYSLVGAGPMDGAYRIAVKRLPDSRGGSVLMHELQPGAELVMSEPRSHFELSFERPEHLLIAGGIGITPLVGMAERLVRHGRTFRMHYAGRKREELPFVDELSAMLGDRLVLHISGEGSRLDIAAALGSLHPDGEALVCGPLGLMDAARTAWQALGRPPTLLRMETFGSGGRFPSRPFTARVRDHGREVTVGERQTMLSALRGAGIDIMWDCLRGECGLCAVTVHGGDAQLDHRDVFLSEAEREEGRKLCACVSRAVGGVVEVDTGFRP